MPRSQMQSDFVVYHQVPAGQLAAGTEPLALDGASELPVAIVRTSEASARATRIVMTLTFVMLAVLALICAIGPHIPAGE